VKYDDASWHYGGDFPADLPPEAGATHIGMFFAWMAAHGMAGELHTREWPDELARLAAREVAPGQYIRQSIDEKLTDEDLTAEGNAFASDYYGEAGYFGDLARVSEGLPTIYHLPDTWTTYDTLAPIISARFAEWRRA
jgi:hypothetical protein